ncbi:phosphoglycerate mutase-like protein [Aureobasidium pullulans]|uniref:Phosphoglycerate mutase-like protein n=1 Tax=Aureobasidium pullulans TaxID=5580 RepID=A0A4S9EPE1_AURPU|nr:phosphoglycerate mutase-like protein [Aureobasidium pullulans]TIA55303.1 phosphoglycerate mutase-like protein [Aureobasidium pullulans]
MADKKVTPRVFIIRHGETEWSLNGRHTGTSDIPLTSNGEKRIRATGNALVGDDRLIVPRNLAHIYVSPRTRSQRTLELLNLGCKDPMPWKKDAEHEDGNVKTSAKVQVTESVREWDYGDYEGLTSKYIGEQRRQAGLHKWDIWKDGCPGGESPDQITERLDAVIAEIREKYHKDAIGKTCKEAGPHDVLIVAHGHILRAFAARWINKNIADNPSMLLDAGGVGTLSYEHHSIDEPAILLGGGFMVDVVENAEEDVKKN